VAVVPAAAPLWPAAGALAAGVPAGAAQAVKTRAVSSERMTEILRFMGYLLRREKRFNSAIDGKTRVPGTQRR
jgi:hypothetical protein